MSLTAEKCLQAWTNSLRQMNAKADIVFFGDSLTYYGNFASVFPDKVVCNLGLRGDTIQGMIERVEQIRLLEPKQMFLMAGINDVAACNLKEFAYRYENLLLSVLNQVVDVDLMIQSMLPVNEKDFTISCTNKQIVDCNKVIEFIADKYKIKYLDLFSQYVNNSILPKDITLDGIHLTPKGYTKWYNLLSINKVD